MTFQPIDTSKLVAPLPTPTVTQSSTFSLTRLFQKISLPSFPPLFSHNQAPAPVFPGQQADAFRPLLPTMTLPPPQYPNAFQPLQPFTPK